jgi:RNA polymerase sigma-70 factor (ECF subfamily)
MSVTDQATVSPEWGEAFTAICDTHRGRLVRWLTAIFGPHDAEDIAQEALARLYTRPGLLDERADAWPWLSVVARNVGRDIARHNAFATAVDSDYLADLPGESRVWDQVSARDDAERLAHALRRLNPQDRALIRLRDMQGHSVADIAAQIGANENTVRQQLFRARRKLASTYVALGGDRRAGLVALLDLRFREFIRKYVPAPVADLISAASATVLAALPTAAVAAGASAIAVTLAAHGPHQPAALPAPALTLAEPGHGIGTRRPAAAPAAPRRPAAHRPARRPIVDEEHDYGPAHVAVVVTRSPLGHDGGTTDWGGIWVDAPVLGRTGFWWEGHKDEGYGALCHTDVVHCE